ncbi:MAG: hypothetical protein QG617_1044 [Campylobacterota bacterium]|nr:hypothetical protein [Campylobacterota bacterium]
MKKRGGVIKDPSINRVNIKSKLLYLSLISLFLVVILSVIILIEVFDDKKNLALTNQHIVEAKAISGIIHLLQMERGLSVSLITQNNISSSSDLHYQNRYTIIKNKLDKELEESKKLCAYDSHDDIVAGILHDIEKTRKELDITKMSSTQIIEVYTKLINFPLDFIKTIPTLMDDRENRNFIQAYSYLVAARESLGTIRAMLSEVFLKKEVDEKSYILVREAFKIYETNLERFESTIAFDNDFLEYYKKNFNSKEKDVMFLKINSFIESKDVQSEADFWFEQSSYTIELLKKIESEIFIRVESLTEKKQRILFYKIGTIFLFLLFGIFFVSMAIVMLARKILKSTNRLNENYLDTLSLLEQYKRTVDSTMVVSKTDTKGIITYANDEFCKISGFSRIELIGKPHSIIRHPDMPREVFKDIWHTIKELKSPWVGEVQNRAKDGTVYWMKTFISPILDKNGNILEYIAIRTDISQMQEDKKRIKEMLGIVITDFTEAQHLAAEYEKAINETWGLVRTDTNNKILYINETFSQMSGYSMQELIGTDCSELRHTKHKNNRDCEIIKGKLQNKEIVKMQFENIAKNNKSYFVDETIVPIVDTKKNIIEHLHLMCNITELVQLHTEIEKTQQEIICIMGEISESRNKETGNHIRRVAEYSKLLALKAGLDEKEAYFIANASPMHDLGKVAIPDSILLKPGKLDDEEWKIMRSHSIIGYKVLSASQRPLLKAAAVIAKEHHEKYDGSGYPFGIIGEEIHIYARIVAIADAFDALGSDRVYKKAWELEKILELFEKEKGAHFDPNLMSIFLDNISEFLQIRDKYKDEINLH